MSNIKKLFNYLLNLEFYTSPLDLFLAKFRKNHPNLSKSQRQEQQKYANIFKEGIEPTPADKHLKIWDKF